MFDKAFSLHKQDLLKGTVLRDFQPFFDQKVLPYCRYYLVFAKVCIYRNSDSLGLRGNNFEGFSLTVLYCTCKEQSGKIKYVGFCVHAYPIAIKEKFEYRRLPKAKNPVCQFRHMILTLCKRIACSFGPWDPGRDF